MTNHVIHPNPDLIVGPDLRESWNTAERRRWGFHNLYRITRYGMHLRSRDVLALKHRIDRRIGDMDAVRRLTGTTMFSAMVVLRGDTLVFEKYAPDFGPDRPHSIMSISKTAMNLVIGRLVADGKLDLSTRVREYLPEIGSGYAEATIQDVMDMNIVNSYDEDYSDPMTAALIHESAMGWRLPPEGTPDETDREFLCTITSDDLTNHSGEPQYKSSSTDVIGWIAERVSGRPLREFFIDIVEASGLQDTFYMSCDRAGVPNLNGGISLSARDLARYGLLFTRGGRGIHGQEIGSDAFLTATRAQTGPFYPAPASDMSYGNQMRTNGRWVGHGGWGGQFLFIDPQSETVVVFYSVLENEDASDWQYQLETIAMSQAISLMEPA
ncbi:MAG: serine hydrolase domain-containing protein [Alphaproteobacteria bacterium]